MSSLMLQKPEVKKTVSNVGTRLALIRKDCPVCGAYFYASEAYRAMIERWKKENKPLPWRVRCGSCGNIVTIAA